VRCRGLENDLLVPGVNPFVDVIEGNRTTRVWAGPVNHTQLTAISDDDLDQVLATVLSDFPRYGRRMIDSHLKSVGIRVSQTRIQALYIRVQGAPARFTRR
jgi:hypothetical protein